MIFRILCLQIVLIISINCAQQETPIVCTGMNTELNTATSITALYKSLQLNFPRLSLADPASFFFGEAPLSESEKNLEEKSNLLLQFSQLINENIYLQNRLYNVTNFKSWLTKHSECISNFFQEFCIKSSDISCDINSKFRILDGSCNNLNNRKWGTAFTTFNNILPPFYDDQVYDIRKSIFESKELPSPRKISNKLYTNPTEPVKIISQNVGGFFYSQFITHDIASKKNVQSNSEGGNGIRCCSTDNYQSIPKSLSHQACIPIQIPHDDPFFGKEHMYCMHNVRSQVVLDNDCKLTAAKQMNTVSSFLDLSNVYSTLSIVTNSLRTFEQGQLKNNVNRVFPTIPNCVGTQCYILGDPRTVQTASLAVFHSIYLREHNRIATIFNSINPHWDDERIFQEARRLNIAQYQHIIYEEYLPAVFGKSFIMDKKDTVNWPLNINPSTTNEFSAGAFRSLHFFIPEVSEYYNKDGTINKSIALSDSIGTIDILESNYDDVVRGLLYQPTKIGGNHSEIVNLLFKNEKNMGVDLLAIDIVRGRDHGINPYVKYRKLCGLKPVHNFNDLYPLISTENIIKLKKIYNSVYDIDMLTGSSLEETFNDSLLGPTLECIIKDQFYRLKFGDIFFYNNPNSPNPFNELQLEEIKKMTLARLLCDNTNIEVVPKNSFLIQKMVSCDNIPSVDLNQWITNN